MYLVFWMQVLNTFIGRIKVLDCELAVNDNMACVLW